MEIYKVRFIFVKSFSFTVISELTAVKQLVVNQLLFLKYIKNLFCRICDILFSYYYQGIEGMPKHY